MQDQKPFWLTKTLDEMTRDEWESLCDGCGRCCLQKLEDEDTGEVYYTDLACRYLELDSCRCSTYSDRAQKVPACIILKPEMVADFHWLPSTCAYRLVSEQQPLPEWHPLVSGTNETVHLIGISVSNRVVSEDRVPEQDWEEHVIHWVE